MICKAFFLVMTFFYLAQAEFPKNNFVYTLDHSNFHNFFEESEVVVLKYFKTGCPACANFESIFQDLAQQFDEAGETNIRFAEVNVMDQINHSLSRYLFKDPSKPAHFPTVKLYFKGLDEEVQFSERERTKETLTTWIKNSLESKAQQQRSDEL